MDRKRIKLIIFICLVIAFYSYTIFGSSYLDSLRRKKPLFTRELTNINQFSEIWHLEKVIITDDKQSTNLVAANNKLFMLGDLNSWDVRLLLIDPYTGDVISDETPGYLEIPFSFKRDISKIAYDDNYLYLGYDGRGKAIGGGVAIYDTKTDNIIHAKKISGTQRVYSVIGGESIILMESSPAEKYFLLNMSGEIIHICNRDFSVLNGVALWYGFVTQETEQCITKDGSVFSGVVQSPVLLDDTLLMRVGLGTTVGAIISRDKKTGHILWETKQDVASNMAVDGQTIFYLTSTAKLVAVNIETGQELGSVQFSNGRVQLGESRGFFVAANEGNVFVYFGDSRQLFAFRFLPDG